MNASETIAAAMGDPRIVRIAKLLPALTRLVEQKGEDEHRRLERRKATRDRDAAVEASVMSDAELYRRAKNHATKVINAGGKITFEQAVGAVKKMRFARPRRRGGLATARADLQQAAAAADRVKLSMQSMRTRYGIPDSDRMVYEKAKAHATRVINAGGRITFDQAVEAVRVGDN